MSYEGGGGNASAWSTFPATQNVAVTGYNLDVDTITGLNGLMVTLSAVTGMDGSNFLTLDGNIIGAAGATGATGSQILYGSTTPGLTAGAANDTYINTTNGDVYSKVSSEWSPTSSSSLGWASVTSDSTGTKLAACAQSGGIWTSDNSGGIWVESDAPSKYWTSIASSSNGTKLVACVLGEKIWTSGDSGLTWTETTSSTSDWTSVSSSSNGNNLVGCITGGTIYFSLGSGASWILSDAPDLAWISVASDSDGIKCLAAVSGGKIWTSINSGQNWTETTSPTSNWTSVTSDSTGTNLVACVLGEKIWTSSDSGANWVESSSPILDWYSVTSNSDGTKLAACAQPGRIWTSIDAGVTWVESDAPDLGWTSVTSNSTGSNLAACAGGQPIYTNSSLGNWILELNITGPAGVTGATGETGPAGPTGSAPQVYQATYYKSSAQNLTSGATDITFGLTGSWNNPGTYIAQTAPTDFTVGITGLYQMEFNVLINSNGATWNSLTNKNAAIDVTRGTEHGVIANTALQASGVTYAQCVSGTYYLHASDLINLRVNNTFAGGPPSAEGLLNTFDLNTFFTWRFIS